MERESASFTEHELNGYNIAFSFLVSKTADKFIKFKLENVTTKSCIEDSLWSKEKSRELV